MDTTHLLYAKTQYVHYKLRTRKHPLKRPKSHKPLKKPRFYYSNTEPTKQMGKKKKRADVEPEPQLVDNTRELDLSNGDEKKKKKKKKKRDKQNDDAPREVPTVSIAVPGSIIHNTQSYELATRLAGQIARAATIFRIDEVVVFDNKSTSENDYLASAAKNYNEDESGSAFLIRILRFLETPQYLRKALFPMHSSLRSVGLLPPLDAPHHLRKHEWAPYREGVTVRGRLPNSEGTLVDVGLSKILELKVLHGEYFTTFDSRLLALKNVLVDQVLEPGVRVTVAMGTNQNLDDDIRRQVVPSSKPKEESGMYWGYKVRYAANISSVFKDCSYKGGYDYLIGTSEHGDIINSSELALPAFRHLLIAFGGLAGLEESIEADDNFKGKNMREVFDSYFNTCPHQGSRTIRTEEAMFISLQYFQEPLSRALQKS